MAVPFCFDGNYNLDGLLLFFAHHPFRLLYDHIPLFLVIERMNRLTTILEDWTFFKREYSHL